MGTLASGGFTTRSGKTERFIGAVEASILTAERYFNIQTGIEYRFGDQAKSVHELLYNSMGPTTDLLRYFPDNLFLDRKCLTPTWEINLVNPQKMSQSVDESGIGLYSFFVEYKFSDSERKSPIGDVPTNFIGIIEREAWLTYKRLTNENPETGTYLDKQRSLIALFYAAAYAPDFLYAQWEHLIKPISIRPDIAQPNLKSVSYSTGSGTPWINFDLRTFKPLEIFLADDLFWERQQAVDAVKTCKGILLSRR